jgi:hypothetical protein
MYKNSLMHEVAKNSRIEPRLCASIMMCSEARSLEFQGSIQNSGSPLCTARIVKCADKERHFSLSGVRL